MTHYLVFMDTEDAYHQCFMKLLKDIPIKNNVRELRIYEISINNENEKEFEEKFLETWNNNFLNVNFMNRIIRTVFGAVFKSKVTRYLKLRRCQTNMRTAIFKCRDKYKKVPELL
jgi:hypothetical protein